MMKRSRWQKRMRHTDPKFRGARNTKTLLVKTITGKPVGHQRGKAVCCAKGPYHFRANSEGVGGAGSRGQSAEALENRSRTAVSEGNRPATRFFDGGTRHG